MRTPIPEALEQQIETVYEEAGYATKSEFVRDAVRRWLDNVENSASHSSTVDDTHFEYRLMTSSEFYKVYLNPTSESPLSLSHSTKFRFDGEILDNEQIEAALSDIQGVENARFQKNPKALQVKISKETERPLNTIVDDVFETLFVSIDGQTNGSFIGYQEETLQDALSRYANET